MDAKTFSYLYHKARGYSDEEIRQETGLSEEEYPFFERTMEPFLAEILREQPAAERIGADFIRLTRYVYAGKSDQQLGISRPDAIKARSGEIVSLPAVGTLSFRELSLQDAISQRQSLRKYSEEALSQEELSFLLWASGWAKDFRSNERLEITFRNVPSAGARHPLECFVHIHRVQGIKAGLYYYHPIKHCLIQLDIGEAIHEAIFEACMRQDMIANSAVNFIFSAVPYRCSWRYGQRGYRYLYLDAGHVGQNLSLAAEAVGCGACMIGAYRDEAMNEVLHMDGVEEFVIYIMTVGKK